MCSAKDQQEFRHKRPPESKNWTQTFLFCVIPEMNYFIRSNYVNSQHLAYIKLNIVNQTEATPPFPSKFYMNQIIEWYLQIG